VGVSFEKSSTEFCQGYKTPAQSSFLDTTKAQPMIGAIKTLGEAAPQELQGYGAVIKSATPRPNDPGTFVIKLNCYKQSLFDSMKSNEEQIVTIEQ